MLWQQNIENSALILYGGQVKILVHPDVAEISVHLRPQCAAERCVKLIQTCPQRNKSIAAAKGAYVSILFVFSLLA